MANNNNMLQLCRLCLVKDDVNIPIFEEQGDIRQIFLKISSCLPVKVSREDRLPKKICDGCSYKLDMLYEFWNTSANAEKQLLSWLGEAGVSSKMADGAISAVAQQMRPAEVKEETLEPDHLHNVDEDDKDYLFEQQRVVEAAAAAGPSATVTSNDEEEPPPKRARRTAAVKAAIAMDQDSDDDDDSGEPLTKIEDESDDSEGEDHVPAFVDVPSTSADDQPGPSGVGKEGVEAPSDCQIANENTEDPEIQCGMCSNIFPNKQAFIQHSMKLSGELYTCCNCQAKFKTSNQLYKHYVTHNEEIVYADDQLVLNYEDSEELLVQPASNELLYILEDSTYVNEVVIEENQPVTGKGALNTKDLVDIEHGYVVTRHLEDTIEEKITTLKRNPQPKKRHAVPDFSATTFEYNEANGEIEMPHYKCVRCEQVFISKFGFSRHIEKGKCYVNNCDVCSQTFASNNDFYSHYLIDHPDRAICNFCFRTFMYEKNVKEHMLRHLDQFRHRCEDCNKGFYTVREYRNHYKNRHMGIRHKCEHCNRTFADEYYFKRHIATHSKLASVLAE